MRHKPARCVDRPRDGDDGNGTAVTVASGSTAAGVESASADCPGDYSIGRGHVGFLEELKGPVVRELEGLDEEYRDVMKEHEAARLEVQQQFERRQLALFKRRRLLLQGDASNNAGSQTSPTIQPRGTPALPGFWTSVLQNSVEFRCHIETHDRLALDYLSDIQSSWLDDTDHERGFMIRFFFEANPYFRNRTVDKIYRTERRSPCTYLECHKIETTKVEWFPGKDVTVDVIARKRKSGVRRRPVQPRTQEIPRRSFFRLYFRNLGPDEDLLDGEIMDFNKDDHTKAVMDEDYDQGLALRDYLIPHAIRWVTGEAGKDSDDDDTTSQRSFRLGGNEDESEESEEEEEDSGRPFGGVAAVPPLLMRGPSPNSVKRR
eukprot:TRINITY_DN29912_c0_g1_i1.p1 TRINITY_DN29912_c0_g1~~TRINITY_DN29912_c0_g1_i1.p1  ORF type:complete len:375 (-),score=44.57 TRINITY_DN29912_c0_g1_i1:85-1209(-)